MIFRQMQIIIYCMYVLVIKQLVIMLLIAISGFAVTKKFKFGKTEQRFISQILLLYVNPCLIINNFNIKFDESKFHGFIVALVLALAAHLVMMAAAVIIYRPKREQALCGLNRLASVFTNCGFIGIPLINGVLGNEGVFYLLAFIVVSTVFIWVFGTMMMGEKIDAGKILTNPNVICIVAGLVIFRLSIPIPEVISKSIVFIGNMNTPMAMILLGMLFANFSSTSRKSYALPAIRLCIVRHVVMGILMLGLLKVALMVIPDSESLARNTICMVTYIACLCPVGMSISSFAVLFGKDESYGALLCLASSLACVVTLPLSVAIAGSIL